MLSNCVEIRPSPTPTPAPMPTPTPTPVRQFPQLKLANPRPELVARTDNCDNARNYARINKLYTFVAMIENSSKTNRSSIFDSLMILEFEHDEIRSVAKCTHLGKLWGFRRYIHRAILRFCSYRKHADAFSKINTNLCRDKNVITHTRLLSQRYFNYHYSRMRLTLVVVKLGEYKNIRNPGIFRESCCIEIACALNRYNFICRATLSLLPVRSFSIRYVRREKYESLGIETRNFIFPLITPR